MSIITLNSSLQIPYLQDLSDKVFKQLDYTIDRDALAVSCALYRMFKTSNNSSIRWTSFSDKSIEVLHCDYEQAAAIRDYYGKIILKQRILGKQLSKFREELSGIILNNGQNFSTSQIGIYYKLPEFFEYDTKIDAIFDIHYKNQLSIESIKLGSQTHSLKPVAKTFSNTRNGDITEYWTKDQNNNPCCLAVASNNILLNLFDHIFSNKNSLNITTSLLLKTKLNYKFLYSHKWKIEL